MRTRNIRIIVFRQQAHVTPEITARFRDIDLLNILRSAFFLLFVDRKNRMLYRFLELIRLIEELLALLKRSINNMQWNSMVFDY